MKFFDQTYYRQFLLFTAGILFSITAAQAQTGGPQFSSQAGNVTAPLGYAVALSVAANGVAPLSFQWQVQPSGSTQWSNLSDNSTYSGSSTPQLSISAATLPMGGNSYQCLVADANGNTSNSMPAQLTVVPYALSILAGQFGVSGNVNGVGVNATFSNPISVVVDSSGNIFETDANNNNIRRITPAGNVTTFAAVTGGLCIDSHDNIYVADATNEVIWKVTPDGSVAWLAGTIGQPGYQDGPASSALFSGLTAAAVDRFGNIYVTEIANDLIRKITPAGVVSTLAGQLNPYGPTSLREGKDGPGPDAQFNTPNGIAIDSDGNIYVADSNNNSIRKITPDGYVSTLAGFTPGFVDGPGSIARFNLPTGLAVDNADNVYVSDNNNSAVRMITPKGQVTTLLQDNTQLNGPAGLAVDNAGHIFICAEYVNTVLEAATTLAPQIQTQPVSANINAGLNASFTIVVVGATPLTYQWQLSSDGGNNWGNLSDNATCQGSGSANLTINAVTASFNNDQLRCFVSNAFGSPTSSPAVLTVSQAAAPVFSSSGGPVHLNATQNITISTATPGASIYYSINNSSNLSTLYTGSVPLNFSGPALQTIYAQATASGLRPSAVTQVSFDSYGAPVIDFPLASGNDAVGSTPYLVASVEQNPFTFTYQWYQGQSGDTSQPILGANLSSYQTPPLTQSSSYWVQVSDGFNFTNSTTSNLTVLPPVVTPVISPDGGAFTSGNQTITLSCSTPGSTIFYQVSSTGSIYGSPKTYTAPISINNTTYLQVYATASGMAQSNFIDASFSFFSAIPAITYLSPQPAPVNFGATTDFTVQANNATSAQWYAGLSGDTSTPEASFPLQANDGFSGFTTPPILQTVNYWARLSNPLGHVDTPTFTATAYPASVVAWGGDDDSQFNFAGQSDVPQGLANVVAIAAGSAFSLALLNDGTLQFWGESYYGLSQNVPLLHNVVAISASNRNFLALHADGTVSTVIDDWNYTGTPPGLNNVVGIAAGNYFFLAVKSDGTVVAWGRGLEDVGESDVPPGLYGVVAVAAGDQHSLALKNDGTVVAWGDDSSGQCDVPAGLIGVVAIAAGSQHSLALKSDGTVVAWGSNYDDQGDTPDQATVPAGLTGVTAIAAQADQSLALKSDGTLVNWGGEYNALSYVPSGLNTLSYSAIAVGQSSGLALLSTPPAFGAQPASNVIQPGQSTTLVVNPASPSGATYQWYQGQSGDTSNPILGANLPYLNTPAISQSTNYWVRATNAAGHTDSGTATVVLSPPSYSQWISQLGLSGPYALANAYPFFDSLPNLVRYSMNLSTAPALEDLPLASSQNINGVPCLTLSYRQRKGLSNLLLIPESSADLVNWTAISSQYIARLPDDDINTARYEVQLPLSSGALFLRLDAINTQ